MADLSLKLVLQALDRGGSATVKRFRAEVHGLSKEVKDAPGGWLKTRAAIDKTTTAASRFNLAGRQGGRTLEDLIDRQRRLRRETNLSESAWGRFTRRVGRPGASGGLITTAMAGRAGGLIGGGIAAGGGLAVAGAGMAGRSVVRTGAQFESYQAVLKVLEGDAGKAKSAMGWVQTFAKKTPYELSQVMDAFVALRSYGIDPTTGVLRSLGDASSAMNKGLMQSVEMLADAQTGEFERLKEFGVRAKVQGDKVTFTYTKAGKDMSVTSKKTSSEIRRTLLGIFDSSFKGAMDEQSRTWNGMVSNLGDGWTGFLKKVADGGAFDKAKGHLQTLLDFLVKAEEDGRLDKWAQQISDSLSDLLDSLARIGESVDWVQLAQDVATLAKAVSWLAEALGKLDKAPTPKPGQHVYNLEKDIGAWWANSRAKALEREKSGQPSWSDKIRSPWSAYSPSRPNPSVPVRGGARPIDALAGPAAQVTGKLEIGLAPGLEIRRKETTGGFDLTERRGLAGGRP